MCKYVDMNYIYITIQYYKITSLIMNSIYILKSSIIMRIFVTFCLNYIILL